VLFFVSEWLYISMRTHSVLAFLFNCSTPEAITKALQAIHATSADRTDRGLVRRLQQHRIVLGAYANRLQPIAAPSPSPGTNDHPQHKVGSTTTTTSTTTDTAMAQPQPQRTDITPQQYYHEYILPWVQKYNVQLIGGCCGISPQHIAYIRQQLDLESSPVERTTQSAVAIDN
jgi:S-methylmethionine-dependent homocysteine/selenocysteine methylase